MFDAMDRPEDQPSFQDKVDIAVAWTLFLKSQGFSESETVRLVMKKQHEVGWCDCKDWANEKAHESPS